MSMDSRETAVMILAAAIGVAALSAAIAMVTHWLP
jgi:hypothetical protein